MTAPPRDRAAIRSGWIAKLDRVDSQLTQAYVHRQIWQAVRDEVARVNPTSDGAFLTSYTRLYAESTMVTIRRLADTDSASGSLWAIWDAVKANPQCASRAEYIDNALAYFDPDHAERDSIRAQSDRHFTESFGAGEYVDPDLIVGYQERLSDDSRVVAAFVDSRLAHLDRKSVASLDVAVLDDALGRVAASANDVHRLLDRTMFMYDMVVVPPMWRASLRGLFPPPVGPVRPTTT